MSDGIIKVKEEYLSEAEEKANEEIIEPYTFIKQKITGFPNMSSIGIEKYKNIIQDELKIIFALIKSFEDIEQNGKIINEKKETEDARGLLSKYDKIIEESERELDEKEEIEADKLHLKYALFGGFGAAYLKCSEEMEKIDPVLLQKFDNDLGKISILLPDTAKSLLEKDQKYIIKIVDMFKEKKLIKNEMGMDAAILYSKYRVTKERYELQKEELEKMNSSDPELNKLKNLKLQLNGIALYDLTVEDLQTQRKVGDVFGQQALDVEVVEWDDVIGQKSAKKLLRDTVVRFLGTYNKKDKKSIFETVLKTKPPKAILLYGFPGTGKTYSLKAAITEAENIRADLLKKRKLNNPGETKKIHFDIITPDQIKNKYIGESSKAIKRVFNQAKKEAPSLLVIDELDAFFSRRSDEGFNEGEREIVSILMQELDGIQKSEGYIIIGMTNMPKVIDKAIISRFEKRIEFLKPQNEKEVINLFKVYLRNLLKNESIPDLKVKDWGKIGKLGFKLGFTGRLVKQFVKGIEQERNDILTQLYKDNINLIKEYNKNPIKMKEKLDKVSKKFTVDYICKRMEEFAKHHKGADEYGI